MSDVPLQVPAEPLSARRPGPLRSALTWLHRMLPEGRRLPDDAWWRRHRPILIALWVHAAGIPVFAAARGYDSGHGLLEALPVAIPALIATNAAFGRTIRTQAAAFGLLSSSAVLVHLSGGTIEMHFHFFVMVTVVALYQDWFPFLMAIGYVFLHHGLMGLLDPTSVYNHPAALQSPWTWAAIHAVFISGISTVCLITWRVNESALAQRTRAEKEAARLYRLEREARSAEEASLRRLEILSDASRILASSLDLDATLAKATRAWVPTVADVCVIDLLTDEPSRLRRTARVAGPGGDAVAEELRRLTPAPDDESHPVASVLRSRRPLLIKDATELMDRVADSPADRSLVDRLGATSAVIVPMVGRQGVLGTIGFATTDVSGRRLGADDLALAEELARRTASAIENGLLYERERGVAETLQRSLLPESLPEIPGLDAAMRYSPGGPNLEVGGDWYDLVVLPGGSIAVAMGDVVGRGLPAATLMGQLRNALRVYALDGVPPRETLRRLNRLLEANDSEHLATLVYGVFDPGSGTLRLGNAGHPPPLVLGPDGAASFIEEGHCMPLGAAAHEEYTETVTSLAPGATLILYTDGLIEDRDTPLSTGLDRLREAASDGPSDTAALCTHLFDRLTRGRSVDDDVALLLIRPHAMGNPLTLRLPSEPRMLASLRATLRRWLAEHGAREDHIADLLTASGEACANAIEHASRPGQAHFEVTARSAPDRIEICVRDEGRWRRPRMDGRGRGLHVIEALTDGMRLERGDEGTSVVMWKRREHEGASR